jgi:hypothetical protein
MVVVEQAALVQAVTVVMAQRKVSPVFAEREHRRKGSRLKVPPKKGIMVLRQPEKRGRNHERFA